MLLLGQAEVGAPKNHGEAADPPLSLENQVKHLPRLICEADTLQNGPHEPLGFLGFLDLICWPRSRIG
ncbi:MAG: hypothetical protein K6U89_05030 [Chloroflexi bacterium]|nr:hypothetical protein [Chloroflexota bacterium]